jgi:redox-sensitive bicupin YhaK (pirin superfamily)
MDQPAYFAVPPETVPMATTDDGKSSVSLFAGAALGLRGPVVSPAAVIAATLNMKDGGEFRLPLPAAHNVLLYLLDGRVRLPGNQTAEGLHAVAFGHDGEGIILQAELNTRALLLSAQPVDEEVVRFGPYVMNTQTQIFEAMRDYRMGRMGILIEE